MEAIYSRQVIENVCEWLQQGSRPAYNYLLENNMQELIRTIESILMEDKGLDWLIINKHYMLSAFVKAVEGEVASVDFLLKNNGVVWAATAAAVNDDKQAASWLVKNGFDHYAVLAAQINKKLKENTSSGFSVLYRGPY